MKFKTLPNFSQKDYVPCHEEGWGINYPSYSTRIYWATHVNQHYYLLKKTKREHFNSIYTERITPLRNIDVNVSIISRAKHCYVTR